MYLLGLSPVPSMSTLEGVKKYINKMGNTPSTTAPKRVVMLDWVSNEDGSHILTVTAGNKVICQMHTHKHGLISNNLLIKLPS